MNVRLIIMLVGVGVFLLIALLLIGLWLLRKSNTSTESSTYTPWQRDLEQHIFQSDEEADARDLVSQGQKIEAIKVVRAQTGMGLKEAKEYVEALTRGEQTAMPTPHPVSTTNLTSADQAEIQSLLERGRKIEAIKIVRARTNMGLKEAKEYVERL